MLTALPSSRDEAWRYSDLKALARVADWQAPVAGGHLTLDDGASVTQSADAQRQARRIVVPAGASATLIEAFAAPGDWCDLSVDIALEPGAKLLHVIPQTRAGVTTAAFTVSVAAQAQYECVALNIGGDFSRLAFGVTLDGAQAQAHLYAGQLGRSAQTLEIVSRVDHKVPDCLSRQTVRTVLAERATGNTLSKTYVAQDAQGTDGAQSLKAMLLARTATANAKPELEIYADDVKCAHGATVGELDKAALFYLASRGLTPEAARALLLQAFLADILAPLPEGALRDLLQAPVDGWMATALGGKA